MSSSKEKTQDQINDHLAHGEDTNVIDNMYEVLRGLVKNNESAEIVETEKTKENYAVPQYGTSCAPSSIWAMLGTFDGIKKQDIENLKYEMGLDSAVKSYNNIQKKKDTSRTAKLMLLDQILFLKKKGKALGLDTKEFKDIETKLKKDLGTKTGEVIIKTKEELKLNNKGRFVIREPKFKTHDSRLTATMKYKDTICSIKVHDDKNDPEKIESRNLLGNSCLLCDAIARGDHEMSEYYLSKIEGPWRDISKLEGETNRLGREFNEYNTIYVQNKEKLRNLKAEIKGITEDKKNDIEKQIEEAEKFKITIGKKTTEKVEEWNDSKKNIKK